MKNLKLALRAFWTILTDKDHVYSDQRKLSFVGTPKTLQTYLMDLLSAAHQDMSQEILVHEAKQLIKQK